MTRKRRVPLDEMQLRGERIFHEKVAPTLASDAPSQFVAIDVESGEFVIASGEREAVQTLRRQRPDAQPWLRKTSSSVVRKALGSRRETRHGVRSQSDSPSPMEIPITQLSPLAQRGEDIFARDIQPTLADADPYDYVAIDVNTGDFEVGPDSFQTVTALRSRHENPEVWVRRVATIYTRRIRPHRLRSRS